MTNALTKARQRHQKAMVAACPGTVTLGGVSYAAAAAVRAGMVENQEGGQRSTNILTVSLAKSQFTVAPAARQKLEYDGKTWLIESVAGMEPWAKSYVITAYL
jgi:hypothetical protein